MRFRLILVLTCAAVFSFGGAALAQSQLTLGSSSQNVVFKQSGELELGQCNSTSCTLGGVGWFENTALGTSTDGAYIFTTTLNSGNLQYDLDSGKVNSGSTSTTLTFVSGSDLWLTADVHWKYIVDSQRPQLGAVLTNLRIGDKASDEFKSAFGTHQTGDMEMTVGRFSCDNLTPGAPCTLENVTASGLGAQAQGRVSSADVIPAPEPASLALLGSGLLLAGGAVRRRCKK